MRPVEVLPAGDRGALLVAGEDAASLAAAVRALAHRLDVGLAEVVPGAQTLLVVAADAGGLRRLLAGLPDLPPADDPALVAGPPVELAVRYGGPDLAGIAAATGMAADEVVRRHLAPTYRAAFTGFAPGFAYLTGLDPALQLPRRDTPRSAVPAGSLAIADTYTAVYPRRSPGGWHLLGTVDTPMFDLGREPAALVSPGQYVRFVQARP